MNEQKANAIFDILVQECGASEEDRLGFVYQQTTEDVREWRFCGFLGFGGKFWNKADGICVNCYREDETPERRKMIDAANKRLEAVNSLT